MNLVDIAGQVWKFHSKTLILLATLLVINLFFFVAIDQWLVPQVVEKETRFLKKQADMRTLLHKQGAAARSPEQRFVLASQDLSRFRQSVPEYQDFTSLIEELLVLSSQAQLNITQIGYSSEEVKESPLLKFNLNFNVAGEYAQVKEFIHSLEQSTRLLVIKQISLNSSTEKGVNLLLSLETYFRVGGEES